MAKQGIAYQQVVAEILGALDPGTRAEPGQWVEGPDGRRDMDVRITGGAAGDSWTILVECKDYDPEKARRVGIEYLDALDSKARDLGVDAAVICSNAGFTGPAISKAKRLGIGLIAVIREGDDRVRFAVEDELYTRRIVLEGCGFDLHGARGVAPPLEFPAELLLYEGQPVVHWVRQRIMEFISLNPIVSGTFKATHKFIESTEFTTPEGPVVVIGLDFQFRISGAWYAHQITFDGTQAVYNWIRRRFHIGPGSGGQLHFKDINIAGGGERIDSPPSSELEFYSDPDIRPGEAVFGFLSIQGLANDKVEMEPVPDVSSLIEPADLDLKLASVPSEAFTSCP